MVASALEAAHGWEAGFVDIRPIRTTGDRVQDRPLAEIGGKALWTKELDQYLLGGQTDFSVHSMKDVESERPQALCIAAMLPRADVRDRLIGAAAIEEIGQGAVVGTSSPRRTAQLLRLRPDLQVVPIRGNLARRLQTVASGEVAATFLAAAGLERLGIAEGSAVDSSVMLPAPAQAAIGIECRTEDPIIRELVLAINDSSTHRCVSAERAFARGLGGSCYSPVAALAVEDGDGGLRLRGEILSSDGSEHVGETVRLDADEDDAAEELARAMLGRAPPEIRGLFE